MTSSIKEEDFYFLEEYKMVNDLLKEESKTFWTRFNVLLSVEALLLTVCTFFLKELSDLSSTTNGSSFQIQPWMFLVGMSMCIAIGIVTSIIWYTVTEKGAGLIAFLAQKMLYMEEKEQVPKIKKQSSQHPTGAKPKPTDYCVSTSINNSSNLLNYPSTAHKYIKSPRLQNKGIFKSIV